MSQVPFHRLNVASARSVVWNRRDTHNFGAVQYSSTRHACLIAAERDMKLYLRLLRYVQIKCYELSVCSSNIEVALWSL